MKYIAFTAVILLIGIMCIGAYSIYKSPKIAYVRTGELVKGFTGAKEAEEKFKQKRDVWKMNIDTLQAEYAKALAEYNNTIASLPRSEAVKREEYLKKQEQNLQSYVQSIKQKAQEEEEQTTKTVLNQINTLVAGFAKEKGYDVILGTTTGGSIVYGSDGYDITTGVLEEINRRYTPDKK